MRIFRASLAGTLLLLALLGVRTDSTAGGPQPGVSRAKALNPQQILRRAAERAREEIGDPSDLQRLGLQLATGAVCLPRPLWVTTGPSVPDNCPGFLSCVTCDGSSLGTCADFTTLCNDQGGLVVWWANGDGTITVACGDLGGD